MNPTDLKIVTVSVNSRLDLRVCIKSEELMEWLGNFKGVSFKEKKNNKDPSKRDRFFNCIMFYYETENIGYRIHIKIFQNGSVQIAGIKTNDMEKIDEIMINILNVIKQATIAYPENITLNSENISDTRITMINSNYCIDPEKKWKINQKKLQTLINENHRIENNGLWKGITKKDTYPALNGKFISSSRIENYNPNLKKKMDGEVTVLIFRSGSIIITGFSNWEYACEAYENVNSIIRENFDNVCFIDKLA